MKRHYCALAIPPCILGSVAVALVICGCSSQASLQEVAITSARPELPAQIEPADPDNRVPFSPVRRSILGGFAGGVVKPLYSPQPPGGIGVGGGSGPGSNDSSCELLPTEDDDEYADQCDSDGGVYDPETCNCAFEPVTPIGSPPTIDPTPVITGIDPSVWQAGSTTPVTISGENFGTRPPLLSFSPGTGIGYSLSTYTDSQITASISVAAGTPNEDVGVTVTSDGYGGNPFYSAGGNPGTSPNSPPAYASVLSSMTTSQLTIIGWINGNAPDILSTISEGPSTTALGTALNGGSVTCNALEFAWASQAAVDLNTAQDSAYATAWLINHASNAQPPNTITPASVLAAPTTYKIFNEFGNGSGAWQMGQTENPCGGAAVSWYTPSGQANQNMGTVGGTAAGNIYALAEGRIGFAAQLIGNTINCGGHISSVTTCTPWIYSVAEFDSSTGETANVTDPANYSPFPTYFVYLNGAIYAESIQEPLADFTALNASNQFVPPPAQ
jgi:hypothetical protein